MANEKQNVCGRCGIEVGYNVRFCIGGCKPKDPAKAKKSDKKTTT